jgi:NhaP-type Na+/H+ or K+/H+ antiporter
MVIETLTSDTPVGVLPSTETIELAIGAESDRARRVATLSLPQAEMVAHALGFAIGQIRERQRRQAEDRAHLAQVVLDTEVRLHGR